MKTITYLMAVLFIVILFKTTEQILLHQVRKKALKHIDTNEKIILQRFVNGHRVARLEPPPDDLIFFGILKKRKENLYSINPCIRRYLQKHPEIVEL